MIDVEDLTLPYSTREFKVEKVYADSDHPLSKFVEDELEIFIIEKKGDISNFYPCRDFFCMTDFDNIIGIKFE